MICILKIKQKKFCEWANGAIEDGDEVEVVHKIYLGLKEVARDQRHVCAEVLFNTQIRMPEPQNLI